MKSVTIRSVRVIDGTGRTIERATVIIRGATISAIGSDRDLSLPRGTTKIDGRGLTLLPGLIDCHVHLCLGAEPDVVSAHVSVSDESDIATAFVVVERSSTISA